MGLVGFDLGTTNSLISVIRGGRPINYLDEDGRPIPSVVCYEGTKTIAGRAAKERVSQAGLGIHGNVIRSPKMYLGRDSVHVEGVERSPVDIVSEVVKQVLREARDATRGRSLDDVTGAVVTIPVDMNGRSRRALRDAFRLAGLNVMQFVHEPLAALYGLFRGEDLQSILRRYDRKLILVFDWGGGTLDLTLCRPVPGMVVQLANDGTDEVGGDMFDELIMNHLLHQVSHKRGIDASSDVQHGALPRLLERCERAKIDLSDRSRVEVYQSGFFRGTSEEDFDYSLEQDELERIVAPLLDKGFQRIERVLRNAGFAPEQVALCVATGGMANMPVVKRRLHETFGGPQRVRVPDSAATLIAEGAAWMASDETGLQLAKNVELIVARNSYLPLVKAGTKMPKETEVQRESLHLYCTDPRDGVAKFQICAPKAAGEAVLPNSERNHLGNLTVKVDPAARAFQERLELDVSINDDLVLEAHGRSLNARDEARCEVHNLEFGLEFPTVEAEPEPHEDDSDGGAMPGPDGGSAGGLTVRANVADYVDLRLVPGEYLYQWSPGYFDARRRPPEEQVRERLYYEPCAVCGMASNDPRCTCG